MMLANRTGSSCLRKAKDVFSHAFSEPKWQQVRKRKRKKKKEEEDVTKVFGASLLIEFSNYDVRLYIFSFEKKRKIRKEK